MWYSIAVQDFPPQLALLAKRFLAAIRNLEQAINDQTKAIHAEKEEEGKQQHPPQEMRAEIRFPEKVERANEKRDRKGYSLQKWNVFAAWATFIVVAVYAVIACRQWRAMLESNQINRDTLQSVQRAFVYFSERINTIIVVDDPRQPTKINEWQFTIPIQNSGTTPVKDMHFSVNTYHSQNTLPEEFDYPDPSNLKTQLIVLGPKQDTLSQPVGVAPDIVEDVRNGRQHLYFYGRTTYRDRFPGTPLHVTEFCYELSKISWVGNIPTKDTIYTFFSDCPNHNCTDEDCKANPN